MDNMKNIKEILQNYEAPYNHKDWLRLKKELPNASKISGLTKIIIVSSAIIAIIVSAVLIFNINPKDNNSTFKNTISENQKIENSEISQNANEVNKEINTTENSNNNTYINNNTETSTNPKDQIIITKNIGINENNKNIENTQTKILITEKEVNNTKNQDNNNLKEENINNFNEFDKIIFSVELIDKCSPAKVKFHAVNCPANYEIMWETGNNTKIYGQNAEFIYEKAGKYTPEVYVINNKFILKSEKLRTFEINNLINLKINFDNSENLYYFTCNNEEDLKLLWTIDNQQFTESKVNYAFENDGKYMINLIGINKFGCKSEASETIIIRKEQVFYVPNAFTPNSDDINSHFGAIGENLDFASFKLFILDANGNKVFEADNPKIMWNGKINNIGNDAKSGIYLWEIRTVDNFGNYQNKKGRVNLIRN